MDESWTSPWDDKLEEIAEDGEIVFALWWDSGAPGPGADREVVYKYQGQYFLVTSDPELYGPYGSVASAIGGFETVGPATEGISCTEMSTEELVALLEYSGGGEEITLTINGEKWKGTLSGELIRDE
jgi:hypothetical protein